MPVWNESTASRCLELSIQYGIRSNKYGNSRFWWFFFNPWTKLVQPAIQFQSAGKHSGAHRTLVPLRRYSLFRKEDDCKVRSTVLFIYVSVHFTQSWLIVWVQNRQAVSTLTVPGTSVKVPAVFLRSNNSMLKSAIRAAQMDMDVAGSADNWLGDPWPRFLQLSWPSMQDQEREFLLFL